MLHGSAAQKMQMNMEDSLSRVGIGVDDETVAILGDAFLRGELFCGGEEMPDYLLILMGKHVERVNMFVGHDQNMSRRGRVQVTEGCYLFVTKYICAGNIPCDDFTENTVWHGCSPKK